MNEKNSQLYLRKKVPPTPHGARYGRQVAEN